MPPVVATAAHTQASETADVAMKSITARHIAIYQQYECKHQPLHHIVIMGWTHRYALGAVQMCVNTTDLQQGPQAQGPAALECDEHSRNYQLYPNQYSIITDQNDIPVCNDPPSKRESHERHTALHDIATLPRAAISTSTCSAGYQKTEQNHSRHRLIIR